MSTDIGGRAVLRPAGNVARANSRKASKLPSSPVKPPLNPPSPKLSPPSSLPSSPKTFARTPPLRPNSLSKLSPHKPPTPSPVSLQLPLKGRLPVAPLDLASDGLKLDVSSPTASDLSIRESSSETCEDEANPSLLESDATFGGSEGTPNGPSVCSAVSNSSFDESKASCKVAKPVPNMSTLSAPAKQPQNVSKSSPGVALGSASGTKRTPNPHIILTKSTSEVFQRNSSNSKVKPKSSKHKSLNKLGSLSFDESSLATMVAAKKAAAKEISAQRKQKVSEYGRKQGKASRVAPEVAGLLPTSSPEPQRCKFITAQSDLMYVEYHDKEWGVPVHDDRMLFELLTLAGFQVELSWTTILHKRDTYRAIFVEFDPSAVALFSEKHVISLEADRSLGLPTGKVRGIVNNAQRILEVMHEVGSLDEFIWGFVNKQPMVNTYRYPKQVPAKTSKAEFISKDLVKRGFRFVGPTIIYSFMQASGMTNDHLVQCFRHQDCLQLSGSLKSILKEEVEEVPQHNNDASHLHPSSFVFEEDSMEGGLLCGEKCVSEQQEQCIYRIEPEDEESHESNTSS